MAHLDLPGSYQWTDLRITLNKAPLVEIRRRNVQKVMVQYKGQELVQAGSVSEENATLTSTMPSCGAHIVTQHCIY
ncbi:hypothetical protein E2C01_058749 [Portunus trituberculatus]|uniref:Uncharacterized protein n=1 Tax=Portunus trituberculatus TaxID=210409 RepID=A0A5B7GWE1_PORTR|nr:hypothetical protein [Portunus trituberculatus]